MPLLSCSDYRMILRTALTLLVCCPAWMGVPAQQRDPATIHGQVFDPSEALVPGAHLTLRPDDPVAQPATTLSDEHGSFFFSAVSAGRYSLTIEASGFSDEQRRLDLKPSQQLTLVIRLKIPVQHQEVAISGETLDSSPDHNMGAIILRGSDLDTLATNPRDLQQQLTAMAGTELPPQFYIDGFTATHLPPKSSILEIRMNQDPYSAEYDTPGAERIEIITKPGGEKLHGSLLLLGEDSALNSQNPYVASQSPYSSFYSEADVNGPLTKSSSWFLTGAQQNIGSQSFIHAITSSMGPAYTQTISSPQTGTEVTPRIDFQLGKIHIVSIRGDFNHTTQDNLLQSQLSLPTQAVDTRHTDDTLQISDTQTYSPRVVNITRFQFLRINDSSVAQNGSLSLLVQGAFNGGGNNLGQSHDGQNRYELQDYASLLRGNHLLLFGGRLRDFQDGNTSTGGYNGQFIFSSIQAYEITQQGIANGLTPAQIRALGGGASQFSVTAGTPKIAVNVADLGVYFEDEWKLSPNITLTPGLRYETQSRISDHADFAPRLSVGWSIGRKGSKTPFAVLRAGAGLFYQRFTSDLILNAARQNGVLQQQYIVQNPDFYPNVPAPSELGPTALSTIYRIDPRLRAPSLLQESIGVDKQYKTLQLHADYTYYRGIDQLLTRNINAPLPGTYNPSDPASGTRPFGTLQNIYEYQSEGASKHHELYVHVRYDTKPVTLYGYTVIGRRLTNTQGPGSFPSDQYDLHVDYGRAANDIHDRGYLGGIIHLPYQFTLNPFFIAESSMPFNITVGQDLNGDSQFNDRPTFATDLSRPSVYRTPWGNFDSAPLPGQKTIPINYGTGPSLVMLNASFSRNIPFGPKLTDQSPPPKLKPGQKPAKIQIARRFQADFSLGVSNLFNHVNGGPPVGVLGSPLFGQSTSLSTTQFSNTQGNRILYLNLTLSF
ncbi:MAG: TonB-dependent receptor [Silvibacterium sp.]